MSLRWSTQPNAISANREAGPKVVAELAVPFRPSAYLRVMPKVHAATPLGMGFGQTRFSAPDNSFKVLYIARDIATAIAETIIRDRVDCH